MLGAFVRHGVTQQECQIEVPFQLIAGSDTTATAIRGTMLHLGVTRHAYLRLQKEIDNAVAEGRISSPIRVEEAKKLEYLQVRKKPSPFPQTHAHTHTNNCAELTPAPVNRP